MEGSHNRPAVIDSVVEILFERFIKADFMWVAPSEISRYLPSESVIKLMEGGMFTHYNHAQTTAITSPLLQGIFYTDSNSVSYPADKVDFVPIRNTVLETIHDFLTSLGLFAFVEHEDDTGDRIVWIYMQEKLYQVARVNEFGNRFRNAKFVVFTQLIDCVLSMDLMPSLLAVPQVIVACGSDVRGECACKERLKISRFSYSKLHFRRNIMAPVLLDFMKDQTFNAYYFDGQKGDMTFMFNCVNDEHLDANISKLLEVYDKNNGSQAKKRNVMMRCSSHMPSVTPTHTVRKFDHNFYKPCDVDKCPNCAFNFITF